MAEPVVNADIALDSNPSLLTRLGAEVFGTFVLVFGVIGTALFSAAFPELGVGFLGVAIAVGLSVLGAAYAVGHISGGHFNPAVSVAAAAAGRFAWKDVLPYAIAQIVGGLLATTLLYVVLANGPEGALAAVQAGGFASNGFGDASPAGFSLLAVIIVELVVTVVFTTIILGVTDRRAPSGFAPIAIGLSLTVAHLVAIPVSNASLNPARSIATAVFGGAVPLTQLWVFILVPTVAGLIGGLLYRAGFEARRAA